MFFPFLDYETITVSSASENSNTTVIASLGYNALIFVEWINDSNGSSIQVFFDNNFATNQQERKHIIARHNFPRIDQEDSVDGHWTHSSNFVRAGSRVAYDSSDDGNGRTGFRLHIFRLPETSAI